MMLNSLLPRTRGVIVIYLFCSIANASIEFKAGRDGDHFVYLPQSQADNILVIAHGRYRKGRPPAEVAQEFIGRWTRYADEYNLVLIAPVFDDTRFGALSQGYGGYRNLFGKYVPADDFVHALVERYSSFTTSQSRNFYLYGHSAGAQFAARYVVTHPGRVIRAVISAAGRYSYPNKAVKWPYGAGNLTKTIQWDDGQVVNRVNISKRLTDYAHAAGKVTIVVGSKDTRTQPVRPGHIGSNRIEFAKSWSAEMNALAKSYGYKGRVNVVTVDGIGHNSRRLTPYCAEVLFSAF